MKNISSSTVTRSFKLYLTNGVTNNVIWEKENVTFSPNETKSYNRSTENALGTAVSSSPGEYQLLLKGGSGPLSGISINSSTVVCQSAGCNPQDIQIISGGNTGATGGCTDYNAAIAPSTNWQTNNRSISSGGAVIYRVAVASGSAYTFKTGCGDGATATFDTYLELYDSNCTRITYDDDGCESNRSSLAWNSNVSGYVYLKVRGYGSSDYGNYTLAYRTSSGSSGGNTGATGSCTDYNAAIAPSTNWQTNNRSISSGGAVIYRVAVASGSAYMFKTGCGDGATATFDTYLELYDSNCTRIIYDDDGCESNRSSLTWNSNVSGYVYLKVRGYGNSDYGNYTLAYKRNATTRSAELLPLSNDPMPDETVNSSVTVSIRENILFVNSPVAEQIDIYSISGARLYSAQKPSGEATFNLGHLPKGVLIVRGGSGWTRKVVN
ncbi:MAG: T9SS type A sorting domain-containing protein [Tannerella sp.]|nr:T9SS type A sorting domain-containing protein [Tannerella sp.]